MKRLLTIVTFSCLFTSSYAQSQNNAIWDIPFSSNKKEANELIRNKKGYTPNSEGEHNLSYQYKNIFGLTANEIDFEFSENAINYCLVSYDASNKERALSIIDALYPELVKQYGYPTPEDKSDKPLSIQKKDDKNYPFIDATWTTDKILMTINITDSFDVQIGITSITSTDNNQGTATTKQTQLTSFWCIDAGMTADDVKELITNEKKIQPVSEAGDTLRYAISEFDEVPSKTIDLHFGKGGFTNGQIIFTATEASYRQVYNTLLSKLEAKYGQPEHSWDSYEVQPIGDSEEEHIKMLKEGKVIMRTIWIFSNTTSIDILVNKDLTITVGFYFPKYS